MKFSTLIIFALLVASVLGSMNRGPRITGNPLADRFINRVTRRLGQQAPARQAQPVQSNPLADSITNFFGSIGQYAQNARSSIPAAARAAWNSQIPQTAARTAASMAARYFGLYK